MPQSQSHKAQMFRPFNMLILVAVGLTAPLIAGPGIASARAAATPQFIAEISAFRDEIGMAASATRVLDRWCASHHMAPAGAVIAEKIANKLVPATARLRRTLQLKASDHVQLRHVRLRCNGHILSVARLWYVPSRLPASMEASLQQTGTPFGKVVAPLYLDRKSAGSSSAWLPKGGQPTAKTPPRTLFSQRALMSRPDGLPIAYVVEDYQRGLLGFTPN
ncbi:hypothetical protein [Sphingobium sp. SA916]|uniref:hypothetical protein n=1 Tax=Sphingobium sp. SA916 TaxID=1851207 RepID=UPI000C9F0FF0|nr:hypothetical protein [Sphingobium sp. SA916]PNP97514.1 hypothetical protein A8G00_21910 [Sphingobium sp. SA916]